jgi:putative aldouronate transport system substrate-binding protein
LKKTWITATICALAISTVLAGCTNNSSTGGNATASPGNDAQPAGSNPVTIKVFADQDTSNEQNLATSWFSQQLEQKFNIKFNWTTVPFDGAPEKRQISLASGDYPDMFLLVPYIDHFTQSDLLRYG